MKYFSTPLSERPAIMQDQGIAELAAYIEGHADSADADISVATLRQLIARIRADSARVEHFQEVAKVARASLNARYDLAELTDDHPAYKDAVHVVAVLDAQLETALTALERASNGHKPAPNEAAAALVAFGHADKVLDEIGKAMDSAPVVPRHEALERAAHFAIAETGIVGGCLKLLKEREFRRYAARLYTVGGRLREALADSAPKMDGPETWRIRYLCNAIINNNVTDATRIDAADVLASLRDDAPKGLIP